MSKKFFLFCSHLNGYNIYNLYGKRVYKYELFWSGIKAADLLKGKSNYILKQKTKRWN